MNPIVVNPQRKKSSFFATTEDKIAEFEAIVGRTASTKLSGKLTKVPCVQIAETVSPSAKKVPEIGDVRADIYNKGFEVAARHIWGFGVATVIGGQYYAWNNALSAAFGSYLIAQVFTGLAYIILVCCISELCSSTAFSGGAYGMTRVVLGFYPGFIVACFELTEYIFYNSMSAMFLGSFFVTKLHLDSSLQPLFWLIFYLSTMMPLLMGGSTFWRFSVSIGVFSLLVIIVYCCGTVYYTDFTHNTPLPNHNYFANGMIGYLQTISSTTYGFGGVESLALLTDLTKDPKSTVPKGMIAAVCTLFISMLCLLFISSSAPPGMKDFINLEYFMNSGFEMFGVNANIAEWLLFPAQYAMAFGFMLPYGKLLYAIADSKMLPPCVGCVITKYPHDPRIAIIIGSILAYLMCLLSYYVTTVNLTSIPIMIAYVVYCADLFAFYKLRTDFISVKREFSSPFGIIGAVFAAIVFVMGLAAIVGFEGVNGYYTVGYVGGFTVLLTIYYYTYAISRQMFSELEQKSLLILHSIIYNKRRREKMMSKRKMGTPRSGANQSSKTVNGWLDWYKEKLFSQRKIATEVSLNTTTGKHNKQTLLGFTSRIMPEESNQKITPRSSPSFISTATTVVTSVTRDNNMSPQLSVSTEEKTTQDDVNNIKDAEVIAGETVLQHMTPYYDETQTINITGVNNILETALEECEGEVMNELNGLETTTP